MKRYLETVLVLFVLASSIILPADLVLADPTEEISSEARRVAAVDAPEEDAVELIDLLWWLRRCGVGGTPFSEWWSGAVDDLGSAGRYFHGGPSR